MELKFALVRKLLCMPLRFVFMLLIVLLPLASFATTWRTVSVASATSLSNWTNGSASPSSFATSGDTWIVEDSVWIPSGAVWTVGSSSSSPSTLIVAPTGKLVTQYGSITTLNVNGDFIINGGSFIHSTNGTNDTVNIHGNFVMNSGSFYFSATSAVQVIHVDSNFTINGGAFTQTANTPKRYLTVGGNFLLSGGTMKCDGTVPRFDLDVYGTFTTTGGAIRSASNSATINYHLYRAANLSNTRLSFTGTGPVFNFTAYDTANFISDSFTIYGTVPVVNINSAGDLNFTNDSISASGNSPTLNGYAHRNFNMASSSFAFSGTVAKINMYLFGNCSITGTSSMTNSGTAGFNTVHLAMPSSSGTMLIENTSSGSWSRTNVFIDTGCFAQLVNNFSSSTGASPTYGMTVNGKLICPAAYAVNGTGIFKLNGSGTLVVANAAGINGNITTSGARTFHTGAVYIYNGTVAQVTGSYLPVSLTSPGLLVINNSYGVTLSQTTATTGTLSFVAGILHTSSHTFSAPGSTSAVTGAGAASFVDGTLIKTISGFTSVNFEVGDTSYAPMNFALSSAGTSGSLGVSCNLGMHPSISSSGILTSNITNHYWRITNYSAAGPATLVPTATYNYADIIGGSNSSFSMQKFTAGSWLSSAITAANTSSPYTSSVTSGIGLSSAAGDYVFGTSCGAPITGATFICSVGGTTTLSNAVSGGTWSSNDTAIANVSGAGIVTGLSIGSTIIYYTTSSCSVSIIVTVGVMPITGSAAICPSSSIALTDSTPGGSWTSSSAGVATVSSSGVVTGVAAGTAIISYSVTAACGTIFATTTVTVTPSPTAGSLSGTPFVCIGATTGLSSTVTGGTWSSSATSIATVSAGTVTGVSVGSAIISYTVTNSCGSDVATIAVSVSPPPFAGSLSGTTSVCVGATTVLSSTATGGTWSCSATSVASVFAGVVTGVSAGTAIISYSVTNGCGTDVATTTVTVNPLPSAGTIVGAPAVCVGGTISLGSTATGGTWSSSSTSVATISGSSVTGISAGVVMISYTVTNSCGTDVATYSVSIDPLPASGTITGADSVCPGAIITLADSSGGGSWSSSGTAVATINTTGQVTGVSTGSVTISYSVTNSCGAAYATHFMYVKTAADCNTGILPIAGGAGAEGFLVYPNPNQGDFVVKIPPDANTVILTLMDVTGRIVAELHPGKVVYVQFDRGNIAKGTYLLRAKIDGNIYNEKIIIF